MGRRDALEAASAHRQFEQVAGETRRAVDAHHGRHRPQVVDARILERERAGRRGGIEPVVLEGARRDVEGSIEPCNRAVGDVLADPSAAGFDEALRPVVAQGIERHVSRAKVPAHADAGVGLPDFALEREARPPGFDDGRLETEPRQRVVDRARHLQPAHRDGLREDLWHRNLARPALDIEEGTAEDAVRGKIERQGARKRNPHTGKLLELRDDGGELRGVQASESDCGAAHLACPVMKQLHVEAGLDILHPEIKRQVADDGGLVQVQGDVGIGRRPCEAGALVVEGESGIAQADTLQPPHRVILAGRVEQIGHQRIGGSIVCAAAIIAPGESKLPLGVADEAEAEPDQLDRGGCNNTAQQGRAAQPECGPRAPAPRFRRLRPRCARPSPGSRAHGSSRPRRGWCR